MFSEYMMPLTDMEKNTILTLAQFGPLCGYDFHLQGKRIRGNRKALMSSGEWHKIKKRLGPGGLKIMEPITMPGRGIRRKNLYWLTDDGLIYAIINGADVSDLLKLAKKVNHNNETAITFLEVAEAVGPEKTSRFFSFVRGKLTLSSLPPDSRMMKKIMEVLRRHPRVFSNKEYHNFKKAMHDSIDELFGEVTS